MSKVTFVVEFEDGTASSTAAEVNATSSNITHSQN